MATARPHGSLYTKINKGIATLEFGHPENNALGSELIDRLIGEFKKLSEDTTVRCIVIASEDDRSFCSGISLQECAMMTSEGEAKVLFEKLTQLFRAMQSCTKIVVARVQGKNAGEGIGLTAACDYVFATDTATLQLPELSLDMFPVISAPFILNTIGKMAFGALALNPTTVKNAYWGRDKGLFTHVYEGTALMDKELYFFTTKLATCDSEALHQIKQTLWEGTENWDKLLTRNAEIAGKQLFSPTVQKALSKIKNP